MFCKPRRRHLGHLLKRAWFFKEVRRARNDLHLFFAAKARPSRSAARDGICAFCSHTSVCSASRDCMFLPRHKNQLASDYRR
jgi:hypothetical protein